MALHCAHGAANAIAVEAYSLSGPGMQARDDAYATYLSQYSTLEIDTVDAAEAAYIIVKKPFITNRYNAGQALVNVLACNTAAGTDSVSHRFIAKGARAAIGTLGTCSVYDHESMLSHVYSRMDGQHGVENRPLEMAILEEGAPYSGYKAIGDLKTTLSPAVVCEQIPCPMKAGVEVVFELDTFLDETLQPEVTGTNGIVFAPAVISGRTITALCLAPPPPGVPTFEITLHWDNVRSKDNIRKLDGNTKPMATPPINARGPSEDDYNVAVDCISHQQ